MIKMHARTPLPAGVYRWSSVLSLEISRRHACRHAHRHPLCFRRACTIGKKLSSRGTTASIRTRRGVTSAMPMARDLGPDRHGLHVGEGLGVGTVLRARPGAPTRVDGLALHACACAFACAHLQPATATRRHVYAQCWIDIMRVSYCHNIILP